MKRTFFFALFSALVAVWSASAQEDTGTASYYGDEFNGRKTASGAVYDPTALTAAHRTLRFGTRLLVTNLDNKRTVVVTVNDRGPFVKNRLIDLSKAAAQDLGLIGPGTARVSIHPLQAGEEAPSVSPEPLTQPVSDQPLAQPVESNPPVVQNVSLVRTIPGSLFIQVGAFKTVENGRLYASALVSDGFQPKIKTDGAVTRVYLIAQDDAQAVNLVQDLTAKGRKTFLQLKNEPAGQEIELTTK